MTSEHPDETPTTQYIDNEKIINEELKIWKKSVPLLYDTIQTHALSSPSLTVEGLPGTELSADGSEVEAKFLIGTYDPEGENWLKLCSVRLPATLADALSCPVPAAPDLKSKLSVKQKWAHPGEVNKARYRNGRIATFTKTGDVKLWSLNNAEADKTLKFHKKDGFALEWSHDGKHLVSGAEDAKIALWDASEGQLVRSYTQHSAIVNDFAWSYGTQTLFGSVSDDVSIKFFDTRSEKVLIDIAGAHNDVINAIEFNEKLPNLFVTGGADNVVNVWDLRDTSKPLRQLFGHNAAVNGLKFNNTEPHLLASSSNDRRIHIWDLQKLDEEFDADDFLKNDEDDPCLRFVHGGHTSKVSEVAWLQGVSSTLVSVGEDSLVEVWRPHLEDDSKSEDDEVPEEEVVPEEKADGDGDEKMKD